jgi:hypothetical protein
MTDRKKPGVAFWTSVVLVVGLAAYPLSLGPMTWLGFVIGDDLPAWGETLVSAYGWPARYACNHSEQIDKVARGYVGWWIPDSAISP